MPELSIPSRSLAVRNSETVTNLVRPPSRLSSVMVLTTTCAGIPSHVNARRRPRRTQVHPAGRRPARALGRELDHLHHRSGGAGADVRGDGDAPFGGLVAQRGVDVL